MIFDAFQVDAAARWYWDTFDFTRMQFQTFEQFRGQMKCFDFLLVSDGYAFTAHFTKPEFEPGVELRPQDMDDLPGDAVWSVDPGQHA